MMAHIRTETSPSSTDSARGAVICGLCGPLVIRGLGHEGAAAHTLWTVVRPFPARGLRHSRRRGVVGEYGAATSAAAPDYADPEDDEDKDKAAYSDANFGAQIEGPGGWVE